MVNMIRLHVKFLTCHVTDVYSVSQKSSPLKHFSNIFTQAKYISMKFCQYVASLYLHTSTNFSWFILIFNKMALIFLGAPIVFTALHGMQTRSYDEISVRPSVCPSVRLSVCHTRALWQNERKICAYFLHRTKEHLSLFSEKKSGWWGRPLLPEILGQPARVGAKSPILNR